MTACTEQTPADAGASPDPLSTAEQWDYTTCVPADKKYRSLFVGGGVLTNDSGQASYVIDEVTFATSDNLEPVRSYLVPGVEAGRVNSVVPDLRARDFHGEAAAWKARVPAEGRILEPGESGEIVLEFVPQETGPWSFDGVKTTYSSGERKFEHLQTAAGTTDTRLCPS